MIEFYDEFFLKQNPAEKRMILQILIGNWLCQRAQDLLENGYLKTYAVLIKT